MATANRARRGPVQTAPGSRPVRTDTCTTGPNKPHVNPASPVCPSSQPTHDITTGAVGRTGRACQRIGDDGYCTLLAARTVVTGEQRALATRA